MISLEFTRQVRLLNSKEFSRVFDNTTLKAANSHLLVLASENDKTHPRLGFVLAKKQVKLAVDRNLVKRVIRESFRHNQHQMANNDFVILARPGLADLDSKELREMIDGLWFRLKRPKNNGRKSAGRKKAEPSKAK